MTDPSGRAAYDVGLRPLAYWDCGFESHWGLDVCRGCCVLSGRGLCGELVTRPEASYRLWYVVVCDIETSLMRRPWPTGSCRPKNKQTIIVIYVDLIAVSFRVKRNRLY